VLVGEIKLSRGRLGDVLGAGGLGADRGGEPAPQLLRLPDLSTTGRFAPLLLL
jgi:hypothetical protein